MIPIVFVIFTLAMAGLWWFRSLQLQNLAEQRALLELFADAVTIWRSKVGVPDDAREAIERLVEMPISRKFIRRFAFRLLQLQHPGKIEENPFWRARQQLNDEQREAFDWLIITFFTAFTYGDYLTGPIIRRARFEGLSRQTQAEIALETVFSRQMGRAVYA